MRRDEIGKVQAAYEVLRVANPDATHEELWRRAEAQVRTGEGAPQQVGEPEASQQPT